MHTLYSRRGVIHHAHRLSGTKWSAFQSLGPLFQGSKERLPGLVGQEGNPLDLFATAGSKLHSQGFSLNIRDETTISVERAHITGAHTQQLGKLQTTANESKQNDTLDALLVNGGQDG